jgi:hypothetical protein
MKNLKIAFYLGLFLALAAALSFAASSVKVIANPSVKADSISADELKSVFLEESDSLHGSHVEPVLIKEGPAAEAFASTYLGKSDSALLAYYRSLVFTGKGSMPKTLASDSEVVTYVAKTKGAIGYVGPGTTTEGVKMLEVK